MQPICQHSQLHAVAQQLVRISSVAAEIYQDQMDLVGHFHSTKFVSDRSFCSIGSNC